MTTCVSVCTGTIRYTSLCRKRVEIEGVKERLALGVKGQSEAAIARRLRDALAAIEQLEDSVHDSDYDSRY